MFGLCLNSYMAGILDMYEKEKANGTLGIYKGIPAPTTNSLKEMLHRLTFKDDVEFSLKSGFSESKIVEEAIRAYFIQHRAKQHNTLIKILLYLYEVPKEIIAHMPDSVPNNVLIW